VRSGAHVDPLTRRFPASGQQAGSPISENVSSKREHLDCVAMNIIVSALDSNELLKVSECSSPKEMWNTLEKYHKNSRSVGMDKEESTTESFPSESRREVCLMTKEESGSSQVSTSSSNNCENYFQLLNAFQETHEKAKRLALLNNRLKSENNKLKEKITVLENDLIHANVYFENLELIYKNYLAIVIQVDVKIVKPFKRKFYSL